MFFMLSYYDSKVNYLLEDNDNNYNKSLSPLFVTILRISFLLLSL